MVYLVTGVFIRLLISVSFIGFKISPPCRAGIGPTEVVLHGVSDGCRGTRMDRGHWCSTTAGRRPTKWKQKVHRGDQESLCTTRASRRPIRGGEGSQKTRGFNAQPGAGRCQGGLGQYRGEIRASRLTLRGVPSPSRVITYLISK